MKSRVALGTVLIAAAILAACDKVPLLAPRESAISVTSQALSLPPGGTTTITAVVTESGGNAVHDGTRVSFSATLGRVEPAEVETRGGTATTTFVAGSASGTAQVRAMSGAATASGATGEGAAATAGNVVQIAIGGAATTAVTISASPSRVGPSGGTVTIVGSALDAAGNRLTGVPISFSTDVGRLSASSALSDGSGEARVTLTTDRQSVVTARSGNQSATVTVTVAAAGTVALATSPTAPVSGSPVTLTVTPATGTSPRVVVNWGDGSAEDLGIVAAVRSVTHTYPRAGSYTITTQATADGETFANSISVSVGSAAAGLTLSDPSPANPTVGSPVVFTVTPGAGTTPRVVIEWGDGSSTDLGTVTAPRSAAHTYAQAGTFIVTATAEASGDTFATSKAVTVSAAAATPVSVTIASNPSSPVDRCVDVTFTASVATPSADPVTTYSWSGAGESGDATNTPSITTRYSSQGTRQVRVNVVTSSGRTGSQTLNFTVNNAGPTTCP